MAKEPPKPASPVVLPTGRAVVNERGRQVWEWLSDTGTFRREIDTERLKALGVDLSCGDQSGEPGAGANPYDQSSTAADAPPPDRKRRSLDDMRRLSEEIKAAHQASPNRDKPGGTRDK